MFGSDLAGVAPHIFIGNSALFLILGLFAVDIFEYEFSEGSGRILQNRGDNLISFQEELSFFEAFRQHGQTSFIGAEAVLIISR